MNTGSPPPGSSPVLLFQRLSQAVAPEYELIRELGGGGMGFVYLALDRTLDRVVAVKAIRPELATAAAVSRFLREARVLARIQHPNIIPVHRAGTADGLPYYVMEYVEGETLADRLKRGPLSEREAITVGRALLDALSAAHAAGVVHRDVKPANVFLSNGRVLLGDFGVARVETTDPDVTSTSGNVGTPAYMAPEQAAGGGATEQSDVYAAAMVIYEMLTGRRWVPVADPVPADWSGVARRYRVPLRRALAWDPARRFNRAATFRRVLSPRYRALRGITISGWVVALAVVVAAVVALWWTRREPRELRDLAIVPFDVVGPGLAPERGEDIASLVTSQLQFPQLRVTPWHTAARWWNAAGDDDRYDDSSLCRRLQARWCTRGQVRRDGDSVVVSLGLLNRWGRVVYQMPPGRAAAGDPFAAAAEAAGWIVRTLLPEFEGTYRRVEGLSQNPDAWDRYFRGEHAFYAGLPDGAEKYYEAAIDLDSTFALARWRLVNVWRWQPGRTPDLQPHLESLAAAGPGRLDPLDSLLVQARLQPAGEARLNGYRDAEAQFSYDAFPKMLWGEELFHRGPLAGVPFDSAAVLLRAAADRDSLFAPAWELLAWYGIRTDRRAEARHSLDRLATINLRATGAEPTYADWLNHAYNERYDSAAARAGREAMFGSRSADAARQLAFAMRIPFAFDLPAVLEAVCARAVASSIGSLQASGHYGVALANAVRGQGTAALAQLDSATAHMGGRGAELQAAEWRTVPAAIGIALFDTEERDVGRAALERLAAIPGTRARATWALALDAAERGDTARAAELRAALARTADDSVAPRLLGILEAQALAWRGDAAGALDRSTASLAWDAEQAHGDPFARSVVHWLRAGWHERVGDPRAAVRELLWAENLDIVGWPGGEPQAAEIDWMLSVHASARRAGLELRMEEDATACRQLERVLGFWQDPEGPQQRQLLADARRWHAERCGR